MPKVLHWDNHTIFHRQNRGQTALQEIEKSLDENYMPAKKTCPVPGGTTRLQFRAERRKLKFLQRVFGFGPFAGDSTGCNIEQPSQH